MRNLKRALSLTLASVMLLGMMVIGTSAASFNDADDISNVTAATILQEIGVMLGDDKGNFGPDQIVTRGQMAIIVCKLLYGDKLNVTQFEGSSQYIDVPVGHYANGYVNLASSLGIINGYGNGYFGPSDPVTTAQAALMLSKALGYYKYNELTGNWAQDSLTAITKATQLTMFEGIVPPTANEGLTRDNVAVMAFNTLTRATPVQFNTIVNEYYTVGGSLTTGVEYIDAYEYGRNSGEYTHTLGYTIYGLYISNRNDTDDFDRPADEWSYEKGGVIGSFNDEPIKVFTEKVTSKALYDAIGKNAVDSAMSGKNDSYDFNVSLNGVPVSYTAAQLNSNKNDDNIDFYKKASSVAVTTNGNSVDKLTDNGVITEVYVDGADRRVDVVVYDVYAAEVYSAKNGKVTLADLFKGPAETDDEFEAEGFTEDQVVIYTYANQKIQSVYAAEKLEGEVTRVRANTNDSEGDNFNVDSKTYSYNRNIPGNERLTTENVDNNVVAYLDSNGYAIYIDESAVTYEYAYVLSTKSNADKYGSKDTISARLVLTDGSILKVDTDDDTETDSRYKIVAYSSNKNDIYTLAQKDKDVTGSTKGTNGRQLVSGGTEIFKNGRATFLTDGNGTYTANSNTIVIVADSDKDPDDYSFTVFTGVKNIPDITAKNRTTVGGRTIETYIDVAADDKGVAKVVYIEDADVSGVGSVIFLRADTQAKLVQASGDNKYYEISAVVDGKVETLMVKESSEAAKILRTEANKLKTQNVEVKAGEQYIAAVKSLTYDNNGLVTNVKFFDNYAKGDGTNWGKGTTATKNQVAFLNNPNIKDTNRDSYPWTDDVTVVRYNVASGKFAVSTINSIKDDTNDNWVSVADDYSLTGVCVIEVKGGEGSGGSKVESKIPSLEALWENWGRGTLTKPYIVNTIKYNVDDGKPEYDDLENYVISEMEDKGWEFVGYETITFTPDAAPAADGEAKTVTTDALHFQKQRSTSSKSYDHRYIVIEDALMGTMDAVKPVSGSTALEEALKDKDVTTIILNGDATVDSVPGKPVEVSKGATLVVDNATKPSTVKLTEEITGEGTVQIKGTVTGASNIKTEGGITLADGASIDGAGKTPVTVEDKAEVTLTGDAETVTVGAGSTVTLDSGVKNLPDFKGSNSQATIVVKGDPDSAGKTDGEKFDDLLNSLGGNSASVEAKEGAATTIVSSSVKIDAASDGHLKAFNASTKLSDELKGSVSDKGGYAEIYQLVLTGLKKDDKITGMKTVDGKKVNMNGVLSPDAGYTMKSDDDFGLTMLLGDKVTNLTFTVTPKDGTAYTITIDVIH